MYRLLQFGATTMPDGRSLFDGGTSEAFQPAVALPGGAAAWDTLGSLQAPLRVPWELRYKAIVTGASLSALETTLAGWRALVGTRAALTRKALGSSANQWVYARLQKIELETAPKHSLGRWQPVEWRFLVLDEYWRAASASSTGYALNASPKAAPVTNLGNAVERGAIVTITTDTSNITALTVSIPAVAEWTFSGAIAAGTALVVDCGARTVRNNGVDAYSSFALTSNHKREDWLPLAVGSNAISVTKTGGSTLSTITVSHYHKYV